MGEFGDFVPVVGHAVDAVGGLVGSFLNRHQQKETRKQQEKMFHEQLDFNREMFDKESQFNAGESQKQRDFTNSERLAQQEWQEKMIQAENAYNDPRMQVFRNRLAGINPLGQAQLVSQSGTPTGTPSGSGGAEAQAHAIGAPSAPNLTTPIFDTSQTSNALANMSTALLQNAQARNLDAQTRTEEFMREHKVSYAKGQAEYIGELTNFTKEETKRVQQLTDNLAKESDNIAARLAEIKAHTMEMEENAKLSRVEQKRRDQAIRIEWEKHVDDLLTSKKYRNLMQSEITLNGKKADTEDETLNLLKQETLGWILDNGDKAMDFEIKQAGHTARVQVVKNEAEVESILSEVEKDFNKDFPYYEKVVGELGRFIDTALSVYDKVLETKQMMFNFKGRKTTQTVFDKKGNLQRTTHTYERRQ